MKIRLIILGFVAFCQCLTAQWIRTQATGNNMVQDWRFASVKAIHPFVIGDTAVYLGTRIDYSNHTINDYSEYFIQKLDVKTGAYHHFVSVPPSNIMRNSSYREAGMVPTYFGLFKSTVVSTGTAFHEPNYLRELYHWDSGSLLWSKTNSFYPSNNFNSCDTSRLIFGTTGDSSYAVINALDGEIFKKVKVDSLNHQLNLLTGYNLSPTFQIYDSYYGLGDTLFVSMFETQSQPRRFVNVKLNRNNLSIFDFAIWDYRPWYISSCNSTFHLRRGENDEISGSIPDSVRISKWVKLSFNGDTLCSFDLNIDYFGKLTESPIWAYKGVPLINKDYIILATDAGSPVNYNIIGTDFQYFDKNTGNLIYRGKILPHSGTDFNVNYMLPTVKNTSFIYTSIGTGLNRMADWRIGRLDSTMQVNDPQFYALSADSPMLDNYITVYPNPVEHAFQFAGVFPIANYEMSLYNSAGEQVMRESFHSRNTVFFPAQHLAQGIYFWRITNNDGSLFASGRLLKK